MGRLDLEGARGRGNRLRLSRVFRDPSSETEFETGLQFELWITFELKANELVDAEVFKSAGLSRPHDEIPLTPLDVLIARRVITDLPFHLSARPDHYVFADFGRDGTRFTVAKEPLLSLLAEQYRILSRNVPEGISDQILGRKKAAEDCHKIETREPERKIEPNDSKVKPTSASMKAGDFLKEIEEILEIGPRGLSATNLEPPTHP